MRSEGLRILARIIARHSLAHPGLYANDSEEERDVASPADGEEPHENGAA